MFSTNNSKIIRTETKTWSAGSAEQYENIIQVGEGTYGKVYKARDKSNERRYVALKCIIMDKEKEGFPLTALREIMILKNLKHPNLINLIEIVSTKQSKDKISNVYLVFEYMEHDMAGLLKNKISFKEMTIKSIFYQILMGVNHLHKNNIIHRDIKSANILINKNGEIKVGDFGLARRVNPDIPLEKNKFTNKVVTLWYRAPEILLGARNYSYSSDIWSLGCMFLEIIYGSPIFKGQCEKSQIQSIFEKCGSPIEVLPNKFNKNEEKEVLITKETIQINKELKNYWSNVSKYDLYYHFKPNLDYPSIFNNLFENICPSPSCFDLISKMLILNPEYRYTCEELLSHEYFSEEPTMDSSEFKGIINETHEFHIRKNNMENAQNQQIANNSYKNSNNNGSSSFLGIKRDKSNSIVNE